MNRIIKYFKYFDLPLMVISGLLLISGLAIQYSISLSGDTMQIFYRQLMFACLGVAIFFVVASYNYHRLAKLNRIFYVLLLAALVYLLLFGEAVRGSARWIDIGFFRLQPAELAKVIVGIGMARWLYLLRGEINSWKNLALVFLYGGLPAFLILREPDLGSSLIVMAIWFGLLVLSPIKKIIIAGFIAAGLLTAVIGWEFLLHDYQKERVEVFLNPEADLKEEGYNVRQAIIAVGSGQVFGRGFGQGIQSQLKFLPERQTDFIFASASEEIGFIGSLSLLALFCLLCWRLLKIMRQSRDSLALYMAGSVLFFFLSQMTVNIGMNIGLLPVTGIPLPFITYGGSSLMAVAISLGIVQNIAKQSKTLRF